jgi:hypothetical protein
VLLTDLSELKRVLELDPDDPSEVAKLNFFIEQASDWILEYLNRKDIEKKSRTEYYDGTGTLELNLKARPVFTTTAIRAFVDEAGYYGQTSGGFASTSELTYGDDFFLKIDQSDGTSRCGILVRRGRHWPQPNVRTRGLLAPFIGEGYGCVKVIYTGGYTVDTLPAAIRGACNLLVARMRYIYPLGMQIGSESYEERHISLVDKNKNYFMSLVAPMLFSYRNWKW